jgi:MFS family permease
MLNNRWFILAVLFVTRFCLGYQFQSAGSVAPFPLEFAPTINRSALAASSYCPGWSALPGGLLAKRIGDKPVVLMGMAVMVLGLLSGCATYAVISAGRLIIGVAPSSLSRTDVEDGD